MNLPLFIGGLLVTIATGILGYVYHQDVNQIAILIFCQATLTVCLEIMTAKTKSDTLLGPLAGRLQKDPDLLKHLRTIATHALAVKRLGSRFMNGNLARILEQMEATTEDMARGSLNVDLGPGGRFYRETNAMENCTRKYQGTSMVNSSEYWHSPVGRESLERNRQAVASGKLVERIFIESRTKLLPLRPIVEEHLAANVRCYVVTLEDVDSKLRRDFALLDDGAVAVELFLDSDRSPTELRFYASESGGSRNKVQELVRVWEALIHHARPAEEFLEHFTAEARRGAAAAAGQDAT